MRKLRVGDFVAGTTGGMLTAYFTLAAVIVLLTGKALIAGPDLPVDQVLGGSSLGALAVRALQSTYFAGLALMTFLGFRFMQELLRGLPARQALKEATTGPKFPWR